MTASNATPKHSKTPFPGGSLIHSVWCRLVQSGMVTDTGALAPDGQHFLFSEVEHILYGLEIHGSPDTVRAFVQDRAVRITKGLVSECSWPDATDIPEHT